jgi:hypothetical protein
MSVLSRSLVFMSTAFFVGFPTFAFAGGSDGSGGKGVVCRNTDGSIRSVMTLDLWEAKTLQNRNPAPVVDIEKAVDSLLMNLAQSFPYNKSWTQGGKAICTNQECPLSYMREIAKRFLKPDVNIIRLRGVELEQTRDALEVAKPSGCAIEQIVNFQEAGAPIDSGGVVYVNQDLIEKMDNASVASLIAHESYYSLLRYMHGDLNSLRTRRAVGYAASGAIFELLPNLAPESKQVVCENMTDARTRFVISPDFSLINFHYVNSAVLVGVSAKSRWANARALKALLFSPDSCKGLKDGERTMNLGTTTMDGSVEYDRSLRFQGICQKQKLKTVLLLNRAPGEKTYQEIPVTCKVRK